MMMRLIPSARKAVRRRWGLGLVLVPALALAPALAHDPSAEPEARQLFSKVSGPADLAPRAIGGYTRGCVAGAVELPADGPFHQAMRLSRNRNWGHPELVDYVEELAQKAHRVAGWPGLLVGDLAQPRGGPMPSSHVSHQIGLDADIWLMPAPPRRYTAEEREELSAVSVIGAKVEVPSGNWKVDPAIWSDGHAEVLKAAASDPRVARIFVHPAIKRALCNGAGKDRAWLRKVRPWYGHHNHFHIRLACPPDSTDCKDQAPPPNGDGCGAALDWWFTEAPYKKPKGPIRLKPELRMADLPKACKAVYEAGQATPVPPSPQ